MVNEMNMSTAHHLTKHKSHSPLCERKGSPLSACCRTAQAGLFASVHAQAGKPSSLRLGMEIS